ncbi:MAG: plasmid maintenance system killer [Hyphomicrobiales bacterium]|nr:plasmid maintenance system killer [Hyphomicrobiales bacterium]
MKITNVRHKGLRRLIEKDDTAGLPAQYIGKIRNIIAFLQDMSSEEEVRGISTWNAHQLTGERKGTWSLFVSRNWRITFVVKNDEVEIIDLDFEDYH